MEFKLEALVHSESLQETLRRMRPVCRRCGRMAVVASTELAPAEDALFVWFSCHDMYEGLRLTRAELTRGGARYIREVWPTYVFDYEATSFGSWDANGAPV